MARRASRGAHQRLRWRPLLPRRAGHSGPDGFVPGPHVRRASISGRSFRRRRREPPRGVHRRDRGRGDHERLRHRCLLSERYGHQSTDGDVRRPGRGPRRGGGGLLPRRRAIVARAEHQPASARGRDGRLWFPSVLPDWTADAGPDGGTPVSRCASASGSRRPAGPAAAPGLPLRRRAHLATAPRRLADDTARHRVSAAGDLCAHRPRRLVGRRRRRGLPDPARGSRRLHRAGGCRALGRTADPHRLGLPQPRIPAGHLRALGRPRGRGRGAAAQRAPWPLRAPAGHDARRHACRGLGAVELCRLGHVRHRRMDARQRVALRLRHEHPRGASATSCYDYEPWHYRHVGREMAREVHLSGITLREWIWRIHGP